MKGTTGEAGQTTRRRIFTSVLCCVLCSFLALYFLVVSSNGTGGWYGAVGIRGSGYVLEDVAFPTELLGTLYIESDLQNERGITPPFWEGPRELLLEKSISRFNSSSNSSAGGEELLFELASNSSSNLTSALGEDLFPSHTLDILDTSKLDASTWGPCYPPSKRMNWTKSIHQFNGTSRVVYRQLPKFQKNQKHDKVQGLCRPGFLIIGAGKCGTSSLYHYLVGHPRVLPASEKQIHYFKYFTHYAMDWYLSHFPTTPSFLSSGALMTGEASPGYMSYPDVVLKVGRQMPGPKIIAIGRDPLERAWSSYNYNYVRTALKKLRNGGMVGVPGKKKEEYYRENHIFSFEEMVRAELKLLKECLKPGGKAETGARKSWGKKAWFKAEYERRDQDGLPALVDLDGTCYGSKVSKTVPRAQWADLVAANPEKLLAVKNLQLVQSIVGRGLYALPLEWWYAVFPREDIYFFCTEELRNNATESMDDLGLFLGLPSFNFTSVVSEGMYNVGGHKGYDKVTSWKEAEKPDKVHVSSDNIPLSPDLRKEFLDFVQPYNDRLFELTGRRCSW